MLLIESRRHKLVYLVVCLFNLLPQDLFHLLLVLGGEFLWRWRLVGCALKLGLADWGLAVGDLWNIWLHGKGNDTSSNLDCLGHLWLQLNLAFRKHQSTELGEVILEVEPAICVVVFDQSVASTNRYVGNSNITLMPSPELEYLLVCIRHDEMDHPRTVFLKRQRLEKQEVFVFGNVLFYVDEPIRYTVRPEYVRIGLLADLTLELLPSVRYQVLLLLLGHLLLEPILQAFIMDVPD